MGALQDDLKLAEQRLESLRRGESKAHSLEEVERVVMSEADGVGSDLDDAERELEAVRSGKSKTSPLEEVMKQYGVDQGE